MYADILAVAPRASWSSFFRRAIVSTVENQFLHIFQSPGCLSPGCWRCGSFPVFTRVACLSRETDPRDNSGLRRAEEKPPQPQLSLPLFRSLLIPGIPKDLT